MAFLDNLDKVGEKISNRSKDVAKKARELADITNLNVQIGAQQDVIKGLYLEIGKRYYKLHGQQLDAEFREQCLKIKAAKEKIENLQSDVQKIKGLTLCNHCGATIPKGSSYCGKCGALVTTTETEEVAEMVEVQRQCPKCGMVIKEGNNFCSCCGYSFDEEEQE